MATTASLPRPTLAPAAPPAAAPRPAAPWGRLLLMGAVLVGLALTWVRHYHLRLDGDIAPIVWPRADYAHILHDPFGWAALRHGSMYAGSNRFFAHAEMGLYFRHVPLWLQAVMSPIDSLYASTASFNVGVLGLLLYVMGWYASGTRRLGSTRLWLAMALMLPFFQTSGYNRQMAIIDTSATYNFFYAFPLMLLLMLLWPLYRAARQGQPVSLPWPRLVAMLLLGVVLAFNSPIVLGTVPVLLLGMGLHAAHERRRPSAEWLRGLPWRVLLLGGWLGAWCLYSLYLGRYNTENITTAMRSLSQRYQLLPYGVLHALADRLGLPLLLLACLANAQLLRRLLPPSASTKQLAQLLRWLGLFALVYVALLPLGGYRSYRPYIVQHDLVLPITVGLVIFYGLSASYLLTQLPRRSRCWYAVAVVAIAGIYFNADRHLYAAENDNRPERRALTLLAHAGPGPVVRLPENCTVLTWDPITEPLSSLTSAELLEYWHVTDGRKLYYYQPATFSAKP